MMAIKLTKCSGADNLPYAASPCPIPFFNSLVYFEDTKATKEKKWKLTSLAAYTLTQKI